MLRVQDPFVDWQPPTHREAAQIAREAHEAALEHLGHRVREDAATTPGWEEYGDELGVHAADGETYLGLPPEHPDHQKYFDLEYGTEDTAPTGFLRNAASRHGREAGRVLSHELVERTLWGRR